MFAKGVLGEFFDQLFGWLKWPVALLSLLLLPGSLLAAIELLRRILSEPRPMAFFLLGFVAYMFVWWLFFRYTRFTLFLTFEHELTHCVFALLTFHKVVGMKVTAWSGGHMSYVGRGNWLIQLAPYFFPTVTVALIIGFAPLPSLFRVAGNVLIGASFAYHITSTFRETHLGQSDLREAGWLFSALFLPTANLVSAGAVLSFCHGGFEHLADYFGAVFEQTSGLLAWVAGQQAEG